MSMNVYAMNKNNISAWLGHRISFMVIMASILATASIIYLLFNHLHNSRLTQIRSQGIELVRLISEIPYFQLVPNNGRRGTLELIKYNESDQNFAYGAIVNETGELITSAVVSGVIIPKLKPPADPSNWLAEKKLVLQGSGIKIVEFHSPLIEKGSLLG
ncbi:MAG: hypothetical protein AB8B92_11425, partial [Gammaproteobacteria bacterium]